MIQVFKVNKGNRVKTIEEHAEVIGFVYVLWQLYNSAT